MTDDAPTGGPGDWKFLEGRWRVRHRKLKHRLAGSDDLEAFEGTMESRPALGGSANVDEYRMAPAAGEYWAMAVRSFNPSTRLWSIWWMEPRYPNLEPPVRGGFQDGAGLFYGEDTLNGKPIRVRFIWSEITRTSARWEQAFSPDGGATWETNWRMDFERLG